MKIVPPTGYEIDKENSTFECIKFKPVESYLPKTWEEFCSRCPIKEGEALISSLSGISQVHAGDREYLSDRNLLPSKEYAEAVRALCQLIQLCNYYNGSWQPNWEAFNTRKYCIINKAGSISVATHYSLSRILAFSSQELRDKFLENFRDLIETAKPLL